MSTNASLIQVNVGCVPKKVMFNAAVQAEHLRIMADYGFRVKLEEFNFHTIKEKRDEYVRRLNAIYEGNLKKVSLLLPLDAPKSLLTNDFRMESSLSVA